MQSEWPSVHVRLFVNNTRTPTAANLSDLLLLDNITGLTVRESAGNQTSRGFQAFRKKFLQGNSHMYKVKGGARWRYTQMGTERRMGSRHLLRHRLVFTPLIFMVESAGGASEETLAQRLQPGSWFVTWIERGGIWGRIFKNMHIQSLL